MAKMKCFYKSECNESEKSLSVVSNVWANNFMPHNGFLLRCKTTTVQQDPELTTLFCVFCMLVGFQLNINNLLQV